MAPPWCPLTQTAPEEAESNVTHARSDKAVGPLAHSPLALLSCHRRLRRHPPAGHPLWSPRYVFTFARLDKRGHTHGTFLHNAPRAWRHVPHPNHPTVHPVAQVGRRPRSGLARLLCDTAAEWGQLAGPLGGLRVSGTLFSRVPLVDTFQGKDFNFPGLSVDWVVFDQGCLLSARFAGPGVRREITPFPPTSRVLPRRRKGANLTLGP